MPDIEIAVQAERLILAVLGGIGFGIIVALIGTTWQRLLLLLVILWTLQTGPQFIWRWLEGEDIGTEVVTVTILRVTFTVAAVLTVATSEAIDRRRT